MFARWAVVFFAERLAGQTVFTLVFLGLKQCLFSKANGAAFFAILCER